MSIFIDPTVLGTQDELLSTPRSNSPTISMTRDTDTDSVGDDFQRPSTSGSSCTSGTGSLPNRVSTTSVRRKRQGDWGREILQVERQKLALIEAQQQKQSQFMEEKDEDNMYFFKSLLPLIRNLSATDKLRYRQRILQFTEEFVAYENIMIEEVGAI